MRDTMKQNSEKNHETNSNLELQKLLSSNSKLKTVSSKLLTQISSCKICLIRHVMIIIVKNKPVRSAVAFSVWSSWKVRNKCLSAERWPSAFFGWLPLAFRRDMIQGVKCCSIFKCWKKYWLYVELTWRMVDEFFYLIPRRASVFVIKWIDKFRSEKRRIEFPKPWKTTNNGSDISYLWAFWYDQASDLSGLGVPRSQVSHSR